MRPALSSIGTTLSLLLAGGTAMLLLLLAAYGALILWMGHQILFHGNVESIEAMQAATDLYRVGGLIVALALAPVLAFFTALAFLARRRGPGPAEAGKEPAQEA